jgi:predicted methyltransferase
LQQPLHISLIQRAHQAILAVVSEGDTVIDATVGNGHDTLFLAQLVGSSGRVYGFDIQQQALDETLARLEGAGVAERVILYHAGHELIAMLLPESLRGEVRAAMFNLGYLPGGEKWRTTTPSTTLTALSVVLELLAPGGCISVIAYTGHPGGREEAEAVKSWASAMPADLFRVALEVANSGEGRGPEWIWIEKKEHLSGAG